MAEKKRPHMDSPDPVSTTGHPSAPRTTGPPPMKVPHSQDPKLRKHKGRSAQHSPPNTPHAVSRTSLMSPVGKSGDLQVKPMLGRLVYQGMATNTVNTAKGSQPPHTTVQGTRYPKGGGQALRPNIIGQTAPGAVRTQSQPKTRVLGKGARVPLHIGMTKQIRGLIGKAKSQTSRYP